MNQKQQKFLNFTYFLSIFLSSYVLLFCNMYNVILKNGSTWFSYCRNLLLWYAMKLSGLGTEICPVQNNCIWSSVWSTGGCSFPMHENV